MRRPIFVRPLSVEEHVSLEQLWRTASPLEQTHILIVLRSSEGLTAAEIAQQVGWTPRAVRRVIERYNNKGILGLHDGRLTNPGRRRVVTEEWQRLLLEVIERPPAAYGFTASRWTVRLLVAYLEQATHIRVSEERVRHYLRLHGIRYAAGNWLRDDAPIEIDIPAPVALAFEPANTTHTRHMTSATRSGTLTEISAPAFGGQHDAACDAHPERRKETGQPHIMAFTDLLAVARGDQPADLLLTNAALVNVFSGRIDQTDIALYNGRIAGIGPGYQAHETIDLQGAYVAPGLIDAHVHIESSLCLPPQFAAALLPRGVTCAVVDPHEMANVAGVAGVRYMVEISRGLPLHTVFMAPSCVPATSMETNGATLSADDLAALLAKGVVYGLAEVMNYPGVVAGEPDVLAKITAFAGRPLDGHAPGLSGMPLNAYAAAGIGSDHECTAVEEAAEKLDRGFYILIREATNARNLHTLLPLVTPHNARRICFCTDDRIPGDLLDQGSIDYMVAEAIAFGIDPIDALRMATLNPAEWFGLHDRGAVAPGCVADLIVFDDLQNFAPHLVFAGGRLVASDGQLASGVDLAAPAPPPEVTGAINVDWDALSFRIPARGDMVRVIGAVPDQLVTEERVLEAKIEAGEAVADPARDILKMAVIDRHQRSGATGLGFIQGFGLKSGAIAGTVAHDHHNLVVIGADDGSMWSAARAIGEMGGGLVVTEGDDVIAALPLPVAGLMSAAPIAEVRKAYDALLEAASAQGSRLHDPFMAMSFMALEVIPKLKLTDQGLVDVEKFAFTDLFAA